MRRKWMGRDEARVGPVTRTVDCRVDALWSADGDRIVLVVDGEAVLTLWPKEARRLAVLLSAAALRVETERMPAM